MKINNNNCMTKNEYTEVFLNNLKDRLKQSIKEGITQEEINQKINHSIDYQFWSAKS